MILAKVRVNGVHALPVDAKYIPKGIIGGQIAFEYTDSMWDGLTKTVVFQGAVTKDVVNAGDLVTIPPEVVQRAGISLHVGVYGTDAENNIAIPTLWADLGRIRAAADPSGDESTDESLPVWAQLQEQVDDLKKNGTGSVDESVIREIVDDYLQENPPAAGKDGQDGEDGGYYTPAVTQPDSNTLQFDFTPNKEDMPAVKPAVVKLPAGNGSGGNVDQSGGLSTTAKNLLITILRNGVYSTDQSGNITALAAELGVTESGDSGGGDSGEAEKTITDISATYSGGDVAVGTAVTALTGVAVTAHYSDGSTEPVTGYTLSGTIAEGENTVTVTYQSMTATFTVTGIAESSGGEETTGTLLYSWDFTKSLIDTVSGTVATLSSEGAAQDENGVTISTINGWINLTSEYIDEDFTIEVDVGDTDAQNISHGRFIMYASDANGTASSGPILYRSTGYWAAYKASWSAFTLNDEQITDRNAIANSTITVKSSATGTDIIYFGSDKVGESGRKYNETFKYLTIGSSSDSYYNYTIKAVRIYKGVA